MDFKALKFTVNKILRRDRKKWPVTVWKLVRRGENWEWESDRGRRTINADDEEEYEFLKEATTTASISYENIFKGPSGHDTMIVAKPENDTFIPVKPEMKVEKGDTGNIEELEELDEEQINMNMFIRLSHFHKVAKNELERHYEITKNESSKWYQAPIIWIVGGLLGLGIMMIMVGIASQKVLQVAAEASKGVLPVAMFKTREKLSTRN